MGGKRSASPVWDVEQLLILPPGGDGTLEGILTPWLGEFRLGIFKLQTFRTGGTTPQLSFFKQYMSLFLLFSADTLFLYCLMMI